MHGAGRKGKLPPVVERASIGCAGHGGDGSGIARRREGFWFKGQTQRSEIRSQKSEKKHRTVKAERRTAQSETTRRRDNETTRRTKVRTSTPQRVRELFSRTRLPG